MQVTAPMIITPSLDAGVQVEDTIIAIRPDRIVLGGQIAWAVEIVPLGGVAVYSGADVRTGAQYAADAEGTRAAMAAVLSFLEADAERYVGTMRDRTEEPADGDGWLFNVATAEWAYGVSDEIAMLRLEIEGDDA